MAKAWMRRWYGVQAEGRCFGKISYAYALCP